MAESMVAGLSAAKHSTSTIREFIVDVLGSLVPGIAFLFWIVPAFVAPVGVALLGLFASIS